MIKSLESFKSQNSNQLNLHSVEMVGDGVRIPIIQQIIEEVTKLNLSKTIAPDECIAKGLCLYSLSQCKDISFNYDFFLGHLSSFDITMKLKIVKDGKTNTCEEDLHQINHAILKPGSYFPTRQVFKLSNLSEILDFEFYSNEQLISNLFILKYLGKYSVKIPTSIVTAKDSYIEVQVFIDPPTLFNILSLMEYSRR